MDEDDDFFSSEAAADDAALRAQLCEQFRLRARAEAARALAERRRVQKPPSMLPSGAMRMLLGANFVATMIPRLAGAEAAAEAAQAERDAPAVLKRLVDEEMAKPSAQPILAKLESG